MDCKDTKENIYRWLDKELPEAQTEGLLAHLQRCPECREGSKSLEAFHGLLRGASSTIEPSKDFERVFWQRVLERQKEPWLVRVFRGMDSLVPYPSASQAATVVLTALLVGGTGGAVSAMNSTGALEAEKESVQYLSGFHEFKGVPFSSVAASYLKAIENGSSA